MLGISSRHALRDLLVAVGQDECGLEGQRRRLCCLPDFVPRAAFERIDRAAKGCVNGTDLWNFLRDNSSYGATLSECDQLVRFFDSDSDGVLSLADLQQMLLTCEDNYLRDSVLARYAPRVLSYERLSHAVEGDLTRIIEAELAAQRRSDSLKRVLQSGYDYSAVAAFDAVDRPRYGRINTTNLRVFMNDHGAFPLENELCSCLRRLDTDGDQQVSLGELSAFLGAPAVCASPVRVSASPVRAASPLRSGSPCRSPVKSASPVKCASPVKETVVVRDPAPYVPYRPYWWRYYPSDYDYWPLYSSYYPYAYDRYYHATYGYRYYWDTEYSRYLRAKYYDPVYPSYYYYDSVVGRYLRWP